MHELTVTSHCPWVDNCVAVNNHKHFMLYILFMVLGIAFLIRLTIACKCFYKTLNRNIDDTKFGLDLEVLPSPTELHCAILNDALCSQYSKDPLTIVTNAWGALQLTWTFMLLFAQLFQIAQNKTTFESMRHTDQVGPVMSAITTGTLSTDAAQVTADGAGPQPPHAHGHGHGHDHSHAKKQSCFGRWASILGIDTFLVIAFQGYKKTQAKSNHQHPKRTNPFTRGLFRNCRDFWSDGPIFGRKESGKSVVGEETVDYLSMYDVPRSGMRYRGGGYEEVAMEEGDVS